MKSTHSIAVKAVIGLLLTLPGIQAHACGVWSYSPQEYFMYRASMDHMHHHYALIDQDLNGKNCDLWIRQTASYIGREDTYQAVYRVPLAQIRQIVENENANDAFYFDGKNNGFLEWLSRDAEAVQCLLLAKKCEQARELYNSPWYYPCKNDPIIATLEEVIEQAVSYKGKRFLSRYAIQAMRAYLTLRRYDEGVKYWMSIEDKIEDDVLRIMILRNVAGCYYGIGEVDTAKQIYLSLGDVSSFYYCLGQDITGLDDIYQFFPDAPYLRDVVKNKILDWENDTWGNNPDKETTYFHDLCLRIAREGKVSDPDFWYYSAAFIEHLQGENTTARRTVEKALKAKGTAFIKDSARILKIYLDSLAPCDNNYERRMLAHVKWIEGKIMSDFDNAKKEISENLEYHKHNLSYYYWNDMLRKIVLGGICPNLLKAGREVAALEFANMAEYMIISRVNKVYSWNPREEMTLDEYRDSKHFNHLDYCNAFFEMADTLSVDIVTKYYQITTHPKGDYHRYLAERSYTDKDYLSELIGTKMLREMRYDEAERWLGAVSTSYQRRLNTERDGFLRYDPFSQEDKYSTSRIDYKYSFAHEMASLRRGIESTSEPNRKATLLARYATGMKNSVGNCWALSFYHLNSSDVEDEWNGSTYFSRKQRAVFNKAESLFQEATGICNDPEMAARIQFYLGNNHIVMEKYPETKMADFIRGHCDTFSDYHFEKKSHFWDYCHAIGQGR